MNIWLRRSLVWIHVAMDVIRSSQDLDWWNLFSECCWQIVLSPLVHETQVWQHICFILQCNKLSQETTTPQSCHNTHLFPLGSMLENAEVLMEFNVYGLIRLKLRHHTGFYLDDLEKIQLQTWSGCWKNPVPYGYKTSCPDFLVQLESEFIP